MEVQLTTKYNFDIPEVVLLSDINRLTNQLWKLIPMRENEESWKIQLETVILEIAGLQTIFSLEDSFLILLSKLEGLKAVDVDFTIYRKTIFECISLLRGMFNGK